MRFLKIATAAIALACVTSISAFAQKPMASPSPAAPKMGKMAKTPKMGKMAKPAKKMPMRDAKGHFISSKGTSKMSKMSKMGKMAKPAKKMPMRDPKTGRFISSKPKMMASPAAPAPK